jgi:hypothetical protein
MRARVRCARIIFRLLNESAAAEKGQAASADDFLPVSVFCHACVRVVYTFISSSPKREAWCQCGWSVWGSVLHAGVIIFRDRS